MLKLVYSNPEEPRQTYPRDLNFPPDAVQCGICQGVGDVCGHGCKSCENKGWVSADSEFAHECCNTGCHNKLAPDSYINFCSVECVRAHPSVDFG